MEKLQEKIALEHGEFKKNTLKQRPEEIWDGCCKIYFYSSLFEQYCAEFNKEVVSKEFFRKFLDGQQRLKCAKFRKEEFPGNPRHGYRGIMLLIR